MPTPNPRPPAPGLLLHPACCRRRAELGLARDLAARARAGDGQWRLARERAARARGGAAASGGAPSPPLGTVDSSASKRLFAWSAGEKSSARMTSSVGRPRLLLAAIPLRVRDGLPLFELAFAAIDSGDFF